MIINNSWDNQDTNVQKWKQETIKVVSTISARRRENLIMHKIRKIEQERKFLVEQFKK